MNADVKRGHQSRVLILDERAAGYLDLIQRRFPSLPLETCNDFANAGQVLQRFAPEIVLAAKSVKHRCPRELLVNAPSIRWIHAMSAGVDHLVPWDAKRLLVTNSRGLFGEFMAQYVMAMILAENLRVRHLALQQARRVWSP